MNEVSLFGRLARDPEMRQTQSGKNVTNFTVAVNRPVKDQPADFIPAVAWNQTAETVSRYFRKGSRIALTGSLQTRSYDDKDGKKVFVMEVLVNRVDFVDTKQESGIPSYNNQKANSTNSARQSYYNNAKSKASNSFGSNTTSPFATQPPAQEDFQISDDDLPF